MAEKPLVQKLMAFQEEVGAIAKDSNNPFYNSQYFDINKLLKEVKPLLTKHGILLLQPLHFIDSPTGPKPALRTSLINASDMKDRLDAITVIPSLDDPQKQGGVITYFRRYALVSILSLEAEDDDANASSSKGSGGAKKSSRKELVW